MGSRAAERAGSPGPWPRGKQSTCAAEQAVSGPDSAVLPSLPVSRSTFRTEEHLTRIMSSTPRHRGKSPGPAARRFPIGIFRERTAVDGTEEKHHPSTVRLMPVHAAPPPQALDCVHVTLLPLLDSFRPRFSGDQLLHIVQVLERLLPGLPWILLPDRLQDGRVLFEEQVLPLGAG